MEEERRQQLSSSSSSILLLHDALIVTMDPQRRVFRNGAVAVQGDTVIAIGQSQDIISQFASLSPQLLNLHGQFLLPGLINTHVHTSQQLARGIADDVDLLTWLHGRIWPYESNMTEEDSYLSTLLCGIELIHSGVSTAVSIFFTVASVFGTVTCFAEAGGQHVSAMARAVELLGIRGCLTQSVMDSGEGLPPSWAKRTTQECIQSQKDLYKKHHNTADGRIRIWFGLRQIMNSTDRLLTETRDAAKELNTGIHMHVAEIPYENQLVVERQGVDHGTVTYLDKIKLLQSNLLAAHTVWVNEDEVGLLSRSGVKVSHCPAAAMHMLGFAPIREMIDAGVCVSLGTDGAPSNNRMSIVDEMYLASLINKGREVFRKGTTDPTVLPAETILEMATINGAKSVLWDKEIGSLEVGKKADMIVVNPSSWSMMPVHDSISSLVYCMRSENIASVMCNGCWIMVDKKILILNEDEVIATAKKVSSDLLDRAGIRIPTRMNFLYESLIAVKVGFPNMKFDAMVDFVCGKWTFMERRRISFTYRIEQVGECYLTEDDDIPALFVFIRRYGIEQIDVVIHLNDGPGISVQDLHINNASVQLIREDDGRVENINPFLTNSCGKDMLSASWSKLIDYVGQEFPRGADEFRKSLIKYSTQVGFEFKYLKNEPDRITAECKFKVAANCPWMVHATRERNGTALVIRKYSNVHRCASSFGSSKKKKFNSKIIVDLIQDDIRNMPGISPRDVMSQVKDKFGVDITYYVAWKSTEAGRARIFGDHSQSYSTLAAYLDELERTNPGTAVDMDIDPIKNNFRRCFFAFAACLSGFKACRPVVMIDGTFMRGKHRGILLTAVGKDGNEGLFPIAFAIVSEETIDNWRWFLEHFKEAINDPRDLVFVSDRNHGILEGVKNVFPGSPHGYCYKHLTRTLRDKFSGPEKVKREEVLKLFAACAYAPTRQLFDINFSKLRAKGGVKISRFLKDCPKETWANAYFPARRYGQMTSNGSESWNSQISDERGLPITKFIDSMRGILMNQMHNRRQIAATWNTVLCKDVEAKMNEHVETSRPWYVRPSTDFIWEVFSTPNAVVDLQQCTCSCRQWQIMGPPCVHAAAVIFNKLHGAYEYVEHYYHTSDYMSAYADPIIPFVQPTFDRNGNIIAPPDYQPPRGRPKRKRIQSRGEKSTTKKK